MTASIAFDLLEGANYGKIRASMTDDIGAGPTISAFYAVTDPLGNVVKAMPGTADATFPANGSHATITLANIPLDVDGKWVKGIYEITVKATYNDGAPATLEKTFEYDFQPQSEKKLTTTNLLTGGDDVLVSVLCDLASLRLKDNNDFTGFTITSRQFFVVPPTVAGQTSNQGVAVNYSSPHTDLQISYDNAIYQWSYKAVIQKSTPIVTPSPFTAITALLTDTVNAAGEVFVDCEGICAVTDCLKAEYDRISNLCKNGSWARLTLTEQGDLLRKLTLFSVYIGYEKCGDADKSRSALEELKKLCDCDCGCGDADTTPKLFG